MWIEGDFFENHYYRVRVRKFSDPSVVNALTGDFLVERVGPGYDHQVATGEWFKYLPPAGSFTRQLAFWSSSGDDKWQIQLDVATAPNEAAMVNSNPWYLIQLDNTTPLGPRPRLRRWTST